MFARRLVADRLWMPRLVVSVVALFPCVTGCSEPVTITATGAREPADSQPAGGGRGRGGEPLLPMPDEPAAIKAIQDAGLPADAVRYGPMRFVETTAAGAEKLSGMIGLESINIAVCDASGDDLAQLSHLPTVNGLLVLSRQVTDEGLPHLAGLVDLKYLWIEQAQVSAAGLEHLQGLTNLESRSTSDLNRSPASGEDDRTQITEHCRQQNHRRRP